MNKQLPEDPAQLAINVYFTLLLPSLPQRAFSTSVRPLPCNSATSKSSNNPNSSGTDPSSSMLNIISLFRDSTEANSDGKVPVNEFSLRFKYSRSPKALNSGGRDPSNSLLFNQSSRSPM